MLANTLQVKCSVYNVDTWKQAAIKAKWIFYSKASQSYITWLNFLREYYLAATNWCKYKKKKKLCKKNIFIPVHTSLSVSVDYHFSGYCN